MITNTQNEAREGLLDAINHLYKATSLINRHGDDFDRRLAIGRQGYAYGDAENSIRGLLRVLLADQPAEVIPQVMDALIDLEDIREVLSRMLL